jgi:RNA polymerase sigma-70 factor (ECF subfamily)
MEQFLRTWPMSGTWRWKGLRTTANGQPALGFYAWDPEEEAYLPFALNVLTIRDGRVSDVVAFVVRSTRVTDPDGFHRWVDEPADPMTVSRVFSGFGLPDVLHEA